MDRNEHKLFTPSGWSLKENYPNPFNPTTSIEYSLPQSGEVSLMIYNLLGQEVARLIDGEQIAGVHSVKWEAGSMASGIYFYRLRAGDFVRTKKMVPLK
ncbi:MAG: T9SS type A sorting domain-containing protein [Candidatus Marinimicrobia bacterium]|nr:T9SS type A sorting domain-containing protein [Candidatus Neomarinimicrobiota bacterium]